MQTFSFRHGLFAMLFLLATLVSAGTTNAQTSANVFGVTSTNQLIRFNTATPGTVNTVGPITGLQSGESILGIDFRPLTGELFALGSTSRIYILNKSTGAVLNSRTLSFALSGTSFGFDFNPVVDRIRIISNTGQNLRVDPSTGTATVDGALSGAATGADAAAYINSFSGTTSTALFDISSTTDSLYTQNPPNSGTLNLVGALGVNATEVNGFDIVSTDGTAYAALTANALSGLYTINTATGSATLVGLIGNGLTGLNGFAIETAMTTNYLVYGVTTANSLVRFNSTRANTILSSVAITGLQGGENILGIDFRPATGLLFGLGSTSRIYRINPTTGAATQVGTAGAFTLSGTSFGFDFNPVPDRIRVTSDADQNLRLNPNDGTLTATDGTLVFAAGDPNAGQNPNVAASGYTNSFAGSTTTTLYDIDSNLDILAIQNPPNSGTLNTVGRLGLNVTGDAGFDISAGNNTALAALQPAGSTNSALYSINLSTGSAAVIGPIGGGVAIRGIAIARSTAATSAQVDFDGDGRTDHSVFRLTNSTWYGVRSSDLSYFEQQFGISSTDTLTPGDYDGDGRTDISVWRQTDGNFYVLASSDNTFRVRQWGLNGDEPVARDYDGDGTTDLAVVRRSGGLMTWYITDFNKTTSRVQQFGFESDIVAPGDYDGDGRFDVAVRRGTGNELARFYLSQSSAGYAEVQWGLGSDLVVPGDYDGDGKTDFTALRTGTNYTWYVLQSSNFGFTARELGQKPDYSTQGDYDGDGKTDISVWDPIDATFRTLRSTTGSISSYTFGLNGDEPVANYDTH